MSSPTKQKGEPKFSLRIGNQTSFAASVLEPFEFAVDNGFTAFEFFPDRGYSGTGGWGEGDLSGATRRAICQTAREKNYLAQSLAGERKLRTAVQGDASGAAVFRHVSIDP